MYGVGRNRGLRYLLSVMAMTIALGAFTVSPVLAETEQTTINGVSEADEECIYEDDKSIDSFLKQLNRAFPEYEVKPENVEQLFYHGQEHNDQVYVNIMETRLIVSDLSEEEDKFRISVFWAYSDEDEPDIDKDIFGVVLKVMDGNLSASEIIDRWEEVKDINNHIVRWDDDILFIGKEAEDDEIFYRWMKFIGAVV